MRTEHEYGGVFKMVRGHRERGKRLELDFQEFAGERRRCF